MDNAPIAADRELVAAVLAGRAGAFERLVRTYQGLCWHIIDRMVRHPEDTRELCQDTFLRVHQCLRQYRGDSPLKSWIGQVAYHVALRHLQRRRIPLCSPVAEDGTVALVERVGDGFDLEAAMADAQLADRLRQAIEALPPVPRTVLTLYHIEELGIPEIAQITGMPAGTIKSHLFRTRLQLRSLLENLGVSA